MSQVDSTIFLPIVFTLFKCFIFFYGILLVYYFFPFISKIKIFFNNLNKIQQLKNILVKV